MLVPTAQSLKSEVGNRKDLCCVQRRYTVARSYRCEKLMWRAGSPNSSEACRGPEFGACNHHTTCVRHARRLVVSTTKILDILSNPSLLYRIRCEDKA